MARILTTAPLWHQCLPTLSGRLSQHSHVCIDDQDDIHLENYIQHSGVGFLNGCVVALQMICTSVERRVH